MIRNRFKTEYDMEQTSGRGPDVSTYILYDPTKIHHTIASKSGVLSAGAVFE